MHTIPGPSFANKYLAPEDRLAEAICGLIMVLSFTAATSAIFEGATPHALLFAVLGCNIAWGIVDGVTYILGNLMNRGARARLILTLQRTPDDLMAARAVQARIDDTLGPLLTPEQRQQVLQWIVEGVPSLKPEPVRIRKADLLTGLVCFLIVFGATIPMLLPFMLLKNEVHALRISNALALAMLFAMGWRWAAFANMSRLKTGLALLAMGVVLVVVTLVLGG
jgi:hypothetical protein